MQKKVEGWIVVNEKDEPIGIDESSGGYPYVPSRIQDVKLFTSSYEEANKYANHFGYSVRGASLLLSWNG
jgi:hypothetical protein